MGRHINKIMNTVTRRTRFSVSQCLCVLFTINKNTMNRLLYILCITVLFISCNSEQWTPEDDIEIDGISATGLVIDGETIWLSDTDENRVVQIDFSGKIITEIKELERPMHLSLDGDQLLVPEYMLDTINILDKKKSIGYLDILSTPDAPAAVDKRGDDVIVADFYNHRVIYKKDGKSLDFGKKDEDTGKFKKGKGPGEFHYPTDVQFAHDKIYVADAYNHRVQVFDLDANHLQTFGEEEYMNASTGIYVTDKYVLVTDFENDRLLTYDLEGKLVDIIDEGLYRPTDVAMANDKLYVLNFKGQFISVYH